VAGICFVNTGSVGRPKDGDWRAAYVLVEMVGREDVDVELVRVEYDLGRAVAAIRKSGLPDDLAEHLETGGISKRLGTGAG
jgi:diadenosine tetraphosphatase ApaH/serine/threonine PP2A family protein phosphatase